MVRLRLTRMGTKKKPFYRIIAADGREKRDGTFLERLGYYDPKTDPFVLKLDLPKVDAWLAKGAQPSDTVAKLIERARKLEATA